MMLEQGSSRPSVDVAHAKKNTKAVQLAADAIGWAVSTGGGGMVIWVVHKEDIAKQLRNLRGGQWLSHIPGMQDACGKVALSKALQGGRSHFWPNFWPRSWLTAETSARQICTEAFEGGRGVLIVKPDGGSQGNGICLARSQDELQRHVKNMFVPEAIVQEYIDPPLLLRGFKWDMRVYVLVIPSPQGNLYSFLAREGLARFCLEPYERPDRRNLHRLTVHLTNYSLSKFSDKFMFSSDPSDATQGCKRSLSAVLRMLEHDTDGRISARTTWESLSLLVRETVGTMKHSLQAAASNPATWEGLQGCRSSPEELGILASKKMGQCFQILGLDVLLDEIGRPWLLEVNNNPSFSLDELRPLPEQSRAETNRLFAESKRDMSGSKWGRPCRCSGHPRPHAHYPCAVDIAVKLPIIQGALTIIQRLGKDTSGIGSEQRAMLAQGTVFSPV